MSLTFEYKMMLTKSDCTFYLIWHLRDKEIKEMTDKREKIKISQRKIKWDNTEERKSKRNTELREKEKRKKASLDI
jgi:triphosphoribosyl-dephospho-CoA synthetase